MFIRPVALLAVAIGVLLLAGCSGSGGAPSAGKQPGAAAPASSARFVIAGSGTNLPITEKIAATFNKAHGGAVEIPKSIGSDGAVKAVQSGTLELGLISRPLTAEEKAADLKELPYARVAIIFGAHPDVPDNGVTSADIVNILCGAKTAWSDNRPIVVLIRGMHDSSNLILFKLIPGFAAAIEQSVVEDRWQIMYHDIDMAENLRLKQGAFGYTDSAELKINGGIKTLTVDSVAPTDENIRSGRYPYSKLLSFVYKGALTDRSKAFIAFVASREGQAIITDNGGTPLQQVGAQ